MGGAITLLSLLITFREGIAWMNSPPGQALPAQVQRQYTISENAQLLGYDLNADVFSPGDRLVFNAYWYARTQPSVDYSSILRLSAEGASHELTHKLHPADLPTSLFWGPVGYVVDRYDVHLPADAPTGDYDLIIGLYLCDGLPLDECAGEEQAAWTGEDGAALGGSAVVATIRVEAP